MAIADAAHIGVQPLEYLRSPLRLEPNSAR
jgi:hypothetical protein